MEYKVVGKTVPAVELQLQRGETVFTQSGGMFWQSDGISMNTNSRGGLLKGFSRMLAGESMFMAHYTADRDGASIGFAANAAGSILPVDLAKVQSLIVQKGAFLCAQDSVQLDTVFTKRMRAGFFGGEGFILQQISGSGMAFLEVDGDLIQKDLAPGEVLKVDTGNVVGFTPGVGYDIEMVKGMGNIFLGGEGLFLTKLTGPGRVFLQTMNFADFVDKVAACIPTSSD